ncbi:hypothetical protein QJS10_CPB15g02092 [Acorus calamus]|uniref:Uncharacterized protein n=1 Tax=Acorus calamus TaxID=4465 RepID=A0AAV9D5Z7_ACOCL|nr:hypothetical protein QJS10_CPB15g02092 [Acorus calamus]
MPALVILDDKQLHKLASLIYRQEVEAIQNINFQSEPELAKYLRDCKSGYDSVLSLVDAGSQLIHKWQDDKTMSPIAHDIFDFVVASANSALQTVRNYTLRLNYLNKISDHSKTLMNALNELNPKSVIEVQGLAEDAATYRNAMLEYTRKYQSPASRNFSKMLKDTGVKFEDLVQRYQVKLNFEGHSVIHKTNKSYSIRAWKSCGEQPIKGIWVCGDSCVAFHGGHDGEVIGVAIPTMVGLEATPLFIIVSGIVMSIVGAYILGEFAGWLIDLIFGSGGTAPLSTDGHRCYVSSMPYGTN